jgi:hypothetical protein
VRTSILTFLNAKSASVASAFGFKFLKLRATIGVLCADFLELAVQFGMVTMFASAYPLVAAFALLVGALSLLFRPCAEANLE